MLTPITCANCGAQYRLPETFTAAQAKCKKCGGVVEIGAVQGEAPAKAEPAAKPAPARKPRAAKPAAKQTRKAAPAKATPGARAKGAEAKGDSVRAATEEAAGRVKKTGAAKGGRASARRKSSRSSSKKKSNTGVLIGVVALASYQVRKRLPWSPLTVISYGGLILFGGIITYCLLHYWAE